VIDAEILTQARRVYDEGRNVTKWFNEQGISITEELIAMVYDFQAGTYTREARANPENKRLFSAEIASGIRSLSEFFEVNSILDCGTGEGTTLAPLLEELDFEGAVLGFDASISRTSWALENLSQLGNVELFVAEISNIPLANRSVDLVLSVHALEPNGGFEYPLIAELARVSARYVVLVEPDFEAATPDQKTRMTELGYIRGLGDHFERAGLRVLEKRKMVENGNPLNTASLWLCEKLENSSGWNQQSDKSLAGIPYVQPGTLEPLELFRGGWRTQEGITYPILNGLPLLRLRDGALFLSPPPKE